MEEHELLSIKEFSEYTGVKQSILRHYDDINLFSPIMRGENNYRYYSPEQIITLNMVGVLTDLRVVLREIGELQRNRTPESILSHLEEQEEKFDLEMRRLQESYSIAHMYRRMISEALTVDKDNIVEREMKEHPMYLGEENKFDKSSHFYNDFIEFCQLARSRKINLSFPVGGIFNSLDDFVGHPSQPDCFFSLDPRGSGKREAGRYVVGYTQGYYGDMDNLPERILAYTKEHNLSCVGSVHVIYVLDEVSVLNPKEYLCRATVKIK